MEDQTKWQGEFLNEINAAINARENGNEGRARVCARRAAGLVAVEYLSSHKVPLSGPSAYDHLRLLIGQPDLPLQAREIINRLLMRVSPDFTLPGDVDLVEDAKLLRRLLCKSS